MFRIGRFTNDIKNAISFQDFSCMCSSDLTCKYVCISFPCQPSTSAVLRLLHLYRSPKSRHHRHSHRPIDPNVLMLEEEEEEFHGSSVAFASSPSETEDEEEEEEVAGGTLGVAPARPTLRYAICTCM